MRLLRFMTLAGAVLFAGTACADLDVENLNDPDRERAIADAGDVETLIAGSFVSWWNANHSWGPGAALSTAADEHTSSWGNFGMKDWGDEPRGELNNEPTYSYSYVIEDPWTFSYRALAGIRDGLIAVEGGLELENQARAVAFARFVQGLTHMYLGALYDKAFILDETTDVETAGLSPYGQVLQAGVDYMAEAINAANGASWSIPGAWLGRSNDVPAAQLARIGHSMTARYMAAGARSVAERDALDWQAILNHTQSGIESDFFVIGTGSCGTCYLDILKAWGGIYGLWGRIDVRTLGPADQSGAYQDWLATSIPDRNAILIDTDDARITEPGNPESSGMYTVFYGVNSSQFRPERGTYHFSDYGDRRHLGYAGTIQGEVVDMPVAENDLLAAEALIRLNRAAEALPLINKYRVDNGELPPATLLGSEGQTRCVPRDAQGNCGDLFEVLKYEKRIEVWHYGNGIAFFDDRGWGDLVANSAIHMPVPGEELLVLLLDIYTFGGGGDGSAPDYATTDFSPDASLDLAALKDRVEALKAFDRDYAARGAPWAH